MSNTVFAITIGSQRTTAAAVKYAGKTRSEIIIEQENSYDAVRHGRIVNVKLMASIISNLILKLNNRAKTREVRDAYIAVGGITMHSLLQQSAKQDLPDLWTVNTERISENEYLHTIMDLKAFQSIEDALNLAKVKSLDLITVPQATSAILTNKEKEDGCLLVDIGFGTTTVQIFSGGHLKHLAVIPIGGDAVTRDIMHFAKLSHDQAERLKTDWSNASVNIEDIDETKKESFEDQTLPIPRQKLNTIVVCRYEEIMKNVLEQIHESGVNGFSIGILTGGGAHQKGIETLTRRILGMPALAIQKRAFSDPCDVASAQKFERSDIYGLCSLCPIPEPKANDDSADHTEAPAAPQKPVTKVEPEGQKADPTDKHGEPKDKPKKVEPEQPKKSSWWEVLFSSNNK